MVVCKFVILAFAVSLVGFTKCRGERNHYWKDGIKAEKNEFPFAAVLGWPNVRDANIVVTYNPICGGSIISDYHILTAGQCVAIFAKYYRMNTLIAVVGAFDRRIKMPEELRIPVKSIDLHPYYLGNPAFINDIAVVTLSDKINFNFGVRPVCLPHPKIKKNGRQVTAVGWGQERYRKLAFFPKKLVTGVMPVSICQQYWRVTHGHLCTFSHSGSFCREESGGPIVMDENSWYILVGVQSVVSCIRDKPVVNIAVDPYVPWIKEVINRGASFMYSTISQFILTELKTLSCSIRTILSRSVKMYCRIHKVSKKSLDSEKIINDPEFQDCITECLKENIQHHIEIAKFKEVFERFTRVPFMLCFIIVTLAIGLSMMKLNEDIVKLGSSVSFASVALGELFNMLNVAVYGEYFLTMVMNSAYSFFNFLKLSKNINADELK